MLSARYREGGVKEGCEADHWFLKTWHCNPAAFSLNFYLSAGAGEVCAGNARHTGRFLEVGSRYPPLMATLVACDPARPPSAAGPPAPDGCGAGPFPGVTITVYMQKHVAKFVSAAQIRNIDSYSCVPVRASQQCRCICFTV